MRAITLVSADISTSPAQDAAAPHPRRNPLCVTLCVAALANVLVPAVFFSQSNLFGHTDPRYRALVAIVVAAEYAIVFLILRLHANVGFASGYALTTAAIVTLGSAGIVFLTVNTAAWSWNAIYAEISVLVGFAFAVLSNVAFLVASIRYARAVHPRPHLGGFLLGMAASLALLVLYAHILP